jgi:hypothetical protein
VSAAAVRSRRKVVVRPMTIKVDGVNWGSGSAAINSLIAGGDLTVKHHD